MGSYLAVMGIPCTGGGCLMVSEKSDVRNSIWRFNVC